MAAFAVRVALAAALAVGPTLPVGAETAPFGFAGIDAVRSAGADVPRLDESPVSPGRPSDAAPGGLPDRAEVAERAYPYAILSDHAYGGRLEDSVQVLDRRRDDASGFDAYAYLSRRTGRVAVVFRGSDEVKDWLKNNLPQPLVLPRQYKQGLDYAEEMRARHGDVVLTGHSLGGGIAQYAALRLGLEAWTFNPAGLGLGAHLRMGLCAAGETCRIDPSRITNVIVAGEPLATARALGPNVTRLFGAVVHFLPAGGGVSTHGMAAVRAALDSALRKSAF